MDFFIKPVIFLGCIILGILMRKKGVFGPFDYQVIMKIVFNVTLPMTVIRSFATFEPSSELFYLIGLGLFCAVIPFFIMYGFVRNKKPDLQNFMLLNAPGYNIGTFTLPLMLGFFGPFGGIVTVMFDIGNAVMMTGGAYALTTNFVNSGGPKPSLKQTIASFTHSTPFMTYMLMMLFAFSGVRLPELVFQLVTPVADANSFLSMLMIGMMFKWSVKTNDLNILSKILVFRYSIALIFSFLIYLFLPMDPFIRKVMMIVVFAPIGGLSAIYIEKCRGNVGLASFVSSVSILISIVIMSFLAFYLS